MSSPYLWLSRERIGQDMHNVAAILTYSHSPIEHDLLVPLAIRIDVCIIVVIRYIVISNHYPEAVWNTDGEYAPIRQPNDDIYHATHHLYIAPKYNSRGIGKYTVTYRLSFPRLSV